MGGKQDEANSWLDGYTNAMRELIEEVGGPKVAVAKLARRGVPPIQIAIVMVGNIGRTAELLGISRQTFDRMRNTPVADWKRGHLLVLEEATGIPADMLKLPVEEAAKLPIQRVKH